MATHAVSSKIAFIALTNTRRLTLIIVQYNTTHTGVVSSGYVAIHKTYTILAKHLHPVE